MCAKSKENARLISEKILTSRDDASEDIDLKVLVSYELLSVKLL